MTKNLTALEAALNMVSPDGDSYTNGWNAYEHVMDTDPEPDLDTREDKAIHFALDAAAPGLAINDFWAAYRTYYDTPQDKKPSAGAKIKQSFGSGKKSTSSADNPSAGNSRPWYRLF